MEEQFVRRGMDAPVLATSHSAVDRGRWASATTMLIVYVVLLVAVPSYVTIGPLGGVGKPALVWGLFLLLWWMLTRLQARAIEIEPVSQPVRWPLAAVTVVVLVSFAAALLRGQPTDQVSPAVTALIRLASWGGVVLVAMDGVRTHADAARLLRALAIAGGALAALGLAQFATGQSLLDWLTSVPGLNVDVGEIAARGTFTRASGTAIHPLEYATGVVGILPIAIAAGVSRGFRPHSSRLLAWWLPAFLSITASVIAVSRSAILGLAVAILATLPAVPRAYRWLIAIGGTALSLVVLALVPGMFGTIVSLFVGASDDPSTMSRTNALARVPDFIESSPVIGQGFGTFLPRYYIFDNQWVLLTVELGIVGVVMFAGLTIAAIGSAVWAGRNSAFADTKVMSLALAASMVTIAVLFAFFDGLSFPIGAGLFFLIAGLCASMRTIAAADIELVAGSHRAGRAE